MKQKGKITTTMIAVIAIVIVAIAAVCAYALTREEEKPSEAALGITTTSLPDGVVDTAYSATLAASGGTTPYTWENIGNLPDGLSLSVGGVISGTPTAEGDFSFTVKVTDSAENTDTKALSIHVGAAGEEPTGTATYAGDWTGNWLGSPVIGTFQFTVDFDAGTVSGWFTGDAAGDVTGAVSELTMDASGAAMGYTINWSGNVTPDGSSVSGNWQCVVSGIGSGTWSGTRST